MFCGLGGFSAGAIDAGATVILGADKDSVPLKLWAANVPGGRATLATLGKDGDAIELPPPSPSIHVHSSPPCTDLSPARNGSVHSAAAADVEGGVRMLRWALDLVLERGDHSWSMENVSTPTTRAVLAEYADRFPGRVGFATLDAAEFGAAQTRIRLIAAPPKLIKLLQEMPSARVSTGSGSVRLPSCVSVVSSPKIRAPAPRPLTHISNAASVDRMPLCTSPLTPLPL